jgi:hypothetical protein
LENLTKRWPKPKVILMRTKQAANLNPGVDVRELRKINIEEEGSVQVPWCMVQ